MNFYNIFDKIGMYWLSKNRRGSNSIFQHSNSIQQFVINKTFIKHLIFIYVCKEKDNSLKHI